MGNEDKHDLWGIIYAETAKIAESKLQRKKLIGKLNRKPTQGEVDKLEFYPFELPKKDHFFDPDDINRAIDTGRALEELELRITAIEKKIDVVMYEQRIAKIMEDFKKLTRMFDEQLKRMG